MGFFSFVKRIGNKVADGIHAAAKVGKKVTGAVSSVGHKIASTATKVLNVVDRIPVIGEIAAPVSGVVRAGVGLVSDVADAAAGANKLISKGDNLVRTGQNALNSGDVAGAIGAVRAGGGLAKDAGALVQKSRGIITNAKNIPKSMR